MTGSLPHNSPQGLSATGNTRSQRPTQLRLHWSRASTAPVRLVLILQSACWYQIHHVRTTATLLAASVQAAACNIQGGL